MSTNTFTSNHLARMTIDEVQGWYGQGVVTQAQYEGFRHAWAHFTPDSRNATGWTDEPSFEDARIIRDEIIATVALGKD